MQNKPNPEQADPSQVSHTCVNCDYWKPQPEGEGHFCERDGEPMGPADYCADPDGWLMKGSPRPDPEVNESDASENMPAQTCGTCGYIQWSGEESDDATCGIEERGAVLPTDVACKAWDATNGEDLEIMDEKEIEEALRKKSTNESPAVSTSRAFDLYQLPQFADRLCYALGRVCHYLNQNPDGSPKIKIILGFDGGIVKADMAVSLPNDVKLKLKESYYIRENGTIKLTPQQGKLPFFDGPSKSQTENIEI